MTPQELLERIDRFPRVQLAEYPTPLQPLPNLSREMARAIYIKRDDAIGPPPGGSKTRKLEFLLADAKQKGARKVLTFGALQSNHARLTAASALQLGLEPHLLYFEKRPQQFEGNLLINKQLGAKMHFVPLGNRGPVAMGTANAAARFFGRIVAGKHYFIPAGGHCALGCLGYVRAACELEIQAHEMGIPNAQLILAAGTGGTLAGLLAGFTLLNSKIRLVGIDIGNLWKEFPSLIAHLAEELCELLHEPRKFSDRDVPLIERTYMGDGYAIPSPDAETAICKLADSEGIYLDPVYTGKAFAALLDLIAKGKFAASEPILFLHTGGLY